MPAHEDAARHLLAARKDRAARTKALPDGTAPTSAEDAYAIQQLVMAELGPIGGWKVGAPNPTSTAMNCSPLPASGIIDSPADVRGSDRVVEAEIAVRIGRDLPPQDGAYTDDEVRAAIASAHPAIEILESRYNNPDGVEALSGLADSLGHHSLVVGPAIPDWHSLDLASEEVVLSFDGQEVKRRTANPAGEMIRLVTWLANTGARWAGGLKAGQVVTTGSWTGKDTAPDGSTAAIRFAHAGEASVYFSSEQQ